MACKPYRHCINDSSKPCFFLRDCLFLLLRQSVLLRLCYFFCWYHHRLHYLLLFCRCHRPCEKVSLFFVMTSVGLALCSFVKEASLILLQPEISRTLSDAGSISNDASPVICVDERE